jgi:hypothetical protein
MTRFVTGINMVIAVFLYACDHPTPETASSKKNCIKSFEFIGANTTDTVNLTDCNGKQGKWFIREYAVLNRNEPAQMVTVEEGFYHNDKKEGLWLKYDKYGNVTDSVNH